MIRCEIANLERKEQKIPDRSVQGNHEKGSNISTQFVPNKNEEHTTRGHGYKLYREQTGALKVVKPWNELDENTSAVHTVDIVKRELTEFGH